MKMNGGIIATGRTAELLACEPDRVLKLFRSGLPRALAEEEFRVSRAVYESGLRVPQPFEMTERDGRGGIVYEKAEGTTMLAAISQNPGIIEEEARRMARLHADMHQRMVEGLPRQKGCLVNKIRETSLLTDEEKAAVIAGLDLLEDDAMLCHGDYHPDNIIVGDKEWIIDWMTAASGSPAADVARSLLLLRNGTLPDALPLNVQEMFARMRERLAEAYYLEYMTITGITANDIERWMVPVAAARLVEWIPEKEKGQLLELVRERL